MKNFFPVLLVSVSLSAFGSEDAENSDITTSALTPEIEAYSPSQPLPQSKKGVLEKTKITLGTIIKSHHFKEYDYQDFNESHNGIYINIDNWSTGTYTNSTNKRSLFVMYNSNLYNNNILKVNLVSGLANGYDGWENAQGDYMPILGFSTQLSYLKAILTYDAIAFGLEMPLN